MDSETRMTFYAILAKFFLLTFSTQSISVNPYLGRADCNSLNDPCTGKQTALDTWILHESEVFSCKALKGEAMCYCEPLITQQMEASDSSSGWKLIKKTSFYMSIPFG